MGVSWSIDEYLIVFCLFTLQMDAPIAVASLCEASDVYYCALA